MKESTKYIAKHHKNHVDAFGTRQKQNWLLQGLFWNIAGALAWTDVKPLVKHNDESSETFTIFRCCILILVVRSKISLCCQTQVDHQIVSESYMMTINELKIEALLAALVDGKVMLAGRERSQG